MASDRREGPTAQRTKMPAAASGKDALNNNCRGDNDDSHRPPPVRCSDPNDDESVRKSLEGACDRGLDERNPNVGPEKALSSPVSGQNGNGDDRTSNARNDENVRKLAEERLQKLYRCRTLPADPLPEQDPSAYGNCLVCFPCACFNCRARRRRGNDDDDDIAGEEDAAGTKGGGRGSCALEAAATTKGTDNVGKRDEEERRDNDDDGDGSSPGSSSGRSSDP